MRNDSYENEFRLQVHFYTDAKGNSEMGYQMKLLLFYNYNVYLSIQLITIESDAALQTLKITHIALSVIVYILL